MARRAGKPSAFRAVAGTAIADAAACGAAAAVLLTAGCATQPYAYRELSEVGLLGRAEEQVEVGVRVRVAVPGAEEAAAIFGAATYDRGIQPVWIEVENGTDERLRFAPVGLDPDYFSPLEVTYILRGGHSKQARAEMDARFDELAMPRRIGPHETRSGYVFTNFHPGTKAVAVDLFGAAASDRSYLFFIDVPDQAPDHAAVDFAALYAPGEVRSYRVDELRSALAALPCCTSSRGGQAAGLPFNLVLVAPEMGLLYALLRAGWYETQRPPGGESSAEVQYYFGRVPDAVFRRRRGGPRGAAGDNDRNELRIWRAPMEVDAAPVWIAQLTHYIGRTTHIEQLFAGSRLDPDLDEGRDYMLQLAWYAQSLRQFAWLGGGSEAPLEQPAEDFLGARYFTGGVRGVLWLSGDPVSMGETVLLDWDEPPRD